MGQVLRLDACSDGYPSTAAALETAETAFLHVLRGWVAAYRRREDPVPALCEMIDTAGARDAAFSVDRLMAVFARTVRRPIAIHCPPCPHLSDDEKCLLHAANLAQAGDRLLTERALRTALLSASGAGFALGPLDGLGGLFAKARLFLRRRWMAAENLAPADAVGVPPPRLLH
jgi:hypothetical protein